MGKFSDHNWNVINNMIRTRAMKSRAIELKTVFKEDDWEIRETNGEYEFAKVPTLIYHQCGMVHSTDIQFMPSPSIWLYRNELSRPCSYCQETPPPGIQAMFQFLNFDHLHE